MVRTFERTLTPAERRAVGAEMQRFRREASLQSALKDSVAYVVAGLLVGAIYFLAIGRPWYLGSLAGLLFVVTLIPLVGFARFRRAARHVRSMDRALRSDSVRVTEIIATEFASFEEFEDLGPLYVFQVEPDKLLVLRGQLYNETPRFPSLHFEIVEIPGVSTMVRPRSPKVAPTASFDDKTMLEVSAIKDRAILDGSISDVLQLLRANAT